MSDREGHEEFYKVGVSNSPQFRFKWGASKVADSDMPLREKVERIVAGERYVSDHPYNTEILHFVHFRYEGEAYFRESQLLADLKESKYWPNHDFSGRSECFRCDDETLKVVVEYMDAAAADAKETELSELQYQVASMGVRATGKIERHLAILENHRRIQEGRR